MPIPLESAQPGMVLAGDVRDRRGRLLLAAGRELTPQALRIIRMWGVTELDVAGAGPESVVEPEAPIAPARLDAARDRAEQMFRHAGHEHPVLAELFRLATLRLAREPADAS